MVENRIDDINAIIEALKKSGVSFNTEYEFYDIAVKIDANIVFMGVVCDTLDTISDALTGIDETLKEIISRMG